MDAALETATWWSYASTDWMVVAVIVTVVAVAAAAYVGRRIVGAKSGPRARARAPRGRG